MQAAVFERLGEPAEVLSIQELEAPEPRAGEVAVRMLAAPINPADLMYIRGVYGKKPDLPATPGFEGVGVVEAGGGGLWGRMLVGRRVAVLRSRLGSWRERTVVDARQAIPLPADIPLEQAAMFFVNPATSYVMTRCVLKVPPGAWLLQTAAGSALGRMVVRLGRRFGFKTLNVVRREETARELDALGADATVVFDGARAEAAALQARVNELTGGQGVPYAIDPVGGATGSAVVGCLGQGGRMLAYGTLDSEPLTFSGRTLMTVGARLEGFWLSIFMASIGLVTKLRLINRIKRLMREGVLVSEVGATFPLAEIADAVRAADAPGKAGKVLLKIGE